MERTAPASPQTLAAPSSGRLYADMVAVLQQEMGEEVLADLFVNVLKSGVYESLAVAADEDVLRFASRIGWTRGLAREAAGKRAEEVVRDCAVAVDRTPAQVSIVFRLYAAGLYGVFPQGVCANPPRCKACALTRHCAYYNAPPPSASRNKTLSPVERLRGEGEMALSEEELLALVLGGGKVAETAGETARELLGRYGSLRKLACASVAELESYASVTRPMAVRLQVAFALGRRTEEEARRMGPAVRSGKDFYDLYHKKLRDLRQEVFCVVLLDQKNRVLRDETISQGSLSQALVHPREVFAPAIREAAAAIALIHNHPSGDPIPSPEDRAITKRLAETARVVGIRLLDHVVVGEGSYVSFVDEGWL